MPNKTSQDAFLRILDAKTGSLVDASNEYLLTLERELVLWAGRIAEELSQRSVASQGWSGDEDEDCDFLYDGPGGILDREDFHSDG